jgi:hypothetical protein
MMKQGTLKAMQVLHRAMLVGLIVFAAIAFLLVYTNKFTPSLADMDHVFQVIAVAISFAGFFVGSALSKKKIQEARDSSGDIKTKAGAYRSAGILQWALLEVPCILCIISFLLVGNYAFLALAAAIMCWFALNGPSKIKAMMLLRLSEEEMESF